MNEEVKHTDEVRIGDQPVGSDYSQDLLEFLEREFARPETQLRRFLGRIVPVFGLVKGLNVTRKAIFARKSTIKYPEEKLPVAKGFRGRHVLLESPYGDQLCICCNACANICPVNCIELKFEPGKNPEKRKRDLIEYNVDLTKCLFCALCQEACPEFCIVLGPEYEYADSNRGQGLMKVRMEDIKRKATAEEWEEIQALKGPKAAKQPPKPEKKAEE